MEQELPDKVLQAATGVNQIIMVAVVVVEVLLLDKTHLLLSEAPVGLAQYQAYLVVLLRMAAAVAALMEVQVVLGAVEIPLQTMLRRMQLRELLTVEVVAAVEMPLVKMAVLV